MRSRTNVVPLVNLIVPLYAGVDEYLTANQDARATSVTYFSFTALPMMLFFSVVVKVCKAYVHLRPSREYASRPAPIATGILLPRESVHVFA